MSYKIDFTTLKTNPKFIQTGDGDITYQIRSSSGGAVNVTFDTPFDHIPTVVASTKGPYSAQVIEVHVQAPTTTGFSILARTAGTAAENGKFQWIAVDLQALPVVSAS